MTTYYENGEFNSDLGQPILPIHDSKSNMNGTYPSCLTMKLIVYYDLNFKEVLGGGTDSGSKARYIYILELIKFYTKTHKTFQIQRVENILAIAETHIRDLTPNCAAWDNIEVKFEIQAIESANVTYNVSDLR